MNGGGDINSLGLLPDKLKTELALHVNLETLKKVMGMLCWEETAGSSRLKTNQMPLCIISVAVS